mmetsp:Transcript_44724/g.136466  ORF Transcript_44724/g.136466 Transcript_44724/m.136466 type:complete len:89 (+) Transcript_44724:961-1227(+)
MNVGHGNVRYGMGGVGGSESFPSIRRLRQVDYRHRGDRRQMNFGDRASRHAGIAVARTDAKIKDRRSNGEKDDDGNYSLQELVHLFLQ